MYRVPRKNIVDRAFIKIMLVYSATKNSAKGPAAYSTLYPETSSNSPSVKSNWARFVSARVEMNHIMARGQDVYKSHIGSCVVIRDWSQNEPFMRRTESKIIALVTSYEIVWATAHKAPNIGYFELDAQPDHRIE